MLITILMATMLTTASAGFSFMGDMIRDMNDAAQDIKSEAIDGAKDMKDEMIDAKSDMIDEIKNAKDDISDNVKDVNDTNTSVTDINKTK